jgi:hypothetical protein
MPGKPCDGQQLSKENVPLALGIMNVMPKYFGGELQAWLGI